ncbi:MAG: hypothetical protein M3Q75_11415 [Gemmatimonadota bacterium]|nr:hypothetical protein [Gemmatimonadota bacterium]
MAQCGIALSCAAPDLNGIEYGGRSRIEEYRAALRHLLHLGGQITYTTKTITVALDTPTTPKITRALRLLLEELNTTPSRIPGDHRPITYKIKTA